MNIIWILTFKWGWLTHELAEDVVLAEAALEALVVEPPAGSVFSSDTGDGGTSFRGGILSLIASRPLASANDVILWLGENPWSAVKNKNKFGISTQWNLEIVSVLKIFLPYVILIRDWVASLQLRMSHSQLPNVRYTWHKDLL